MSYFNSDDQSGETQSAIEKLIAEKGEQWKDPEAIAKGYLSAQEHIKSIERKNAELLEDLTKAKSREEVLEELRKQTARPTGGDATQNTITSGGAQNTTAPAPEDINSLITKALTEREKANTAAQNLKEADRLLTERFGTEAGKHVNTKAQQLGLSQERLREIASESPTAFLALVGEAPKAEPGNAPPRSSVNTQSDAFQSSSNERTWEWYQEIRRKNPSLYYSPKMQRQLEQDYASGRVQL